MKPGTILYDKCDGHYKRLNSAFIGEIDWAPDLGKAKWWWLDVKIGPKWACQAEMLSFVTVNELRVVGRLEALVVLGEKV